MVSLKVVEEEFVEKLFQTPLGHAARLSNWPEFNKHFLSRDRGTGTFAFFNTIPRGEIRLALAS